MSDTSRNPLDDPAGDADRQGVTPARTGSTEAPGPAPDAANGEVEREDAGDARRSSVEGVDEGAAGREAIRGDRTSREPKPSSCSASAMHH